VSRLIPALLTVLAAAGCGGSDEPEPLSEPPAELLADALANPPSSGEVRIDADAELDGGSLLGDSAGAELEGPFAAAARGELPRFSLALDGELAGFGVDGELTSTGDDAFVVFFGENYRVGAERSGAAAARWASAAEEVGALAPAVPSWFDDPRYGEAEEVAGVEAQAIEAELDGPRAGRDIAAVARALGAPALFEALATGAGRGSAEAWIAPEDRTLRRLRLEFPFRVDAGERIAALGVDSGTASIEIELSELGEPVEIEPPPGGGFQPIEQLTGRLADLARLGGF
jgi:hypothetical protein